MSITSNDIIAIEYGSEYTEFVYDAHRCMCDVCRDMVSVIYYLPCDMMLCMSCLGVWKNNPDWLELIKLVTEAENDPL